MDDYKYQTLKMYTRARHQLVQELTREKQRLLNTVFISFSGLTQEKILRNMPVLSGLSTSPVTLKLRTSA